MTLDLKSLHNVFKVGKRVVADAGFDPIYGARPLKRAIQKYLEDELAELMLSTKVSQGDEIIVGYDEENKKIVTQVISSETQPKID